MFVRVEHEVAGNILAGNHIFLSLPKKNIKLDYIMLEAGFYISISLVLFAYFGYPFSLWILGLFKKRVVQKVPYFPVVTMIITAYNEEKGIGKKLANTLAIDYPMDELQILVASDGSTDRTNEIVRRYGKNGVELIALPARGGKENAQKEAVKRAKGEILVFSDTAAQLDPGTLKEIVFNFADSSVGCVSSEDRLIGTDGTPSGEGLYVKYEMYLRQLESKANSLVGLSGSLFAARKEVCKDFSGEMQSDFRTVLNSIKLGLRAICDPAAVGYYTNVLDEKKEFDRKVRTVLRGITVFFRHVELLNVLKYGLFSYQYFCHKLLRWLVPFLLLIAFISNLLLCAGTGIYLAVFVGQCLFYGAGTWAWKRGDSSMNFLVRVPMYFLIVNSSIIVAWGKYLKGKRVVMWTPSER